MDRKDILDMASEAGFADGIVDIVGFSGFDAFAKLVAKRYGGETANQILSAATAYTRDMERNRIALMIEQMGVEGYGTLAIAAAVRAGHHMRQD